MRRCDVCDQEPDEIGVTNEFNCALICAGCYFDLWLSDTEGIRICPICEEIEEDVFIRKEFEDKFMCDRCYQEECHNALNSGKGDSQIDGKAFNEIKNSNLRRK